MSRYQTAVDLTVRNSSQTLEVELVGPGKRVLDVGCAGGFLADALNSQGCKVSGVELDPEAAEEARPKLERLVVGNIEESPLADSFPGEKFDAIVFGDILEHLRDPAAVLRSALEILADDGRIVISVPNVAHGSLRLALLQSRWRYRDTGLLDRTHITFFTLESLVEMLTSVGLVIHEAWAPVLDVLGTEVEIDADALPEGIVDWVRHQPRALEYQYVVSVSPGEPTGELPTVQTPLTRDQIVPDDEHAQAAREIAARHHAELVQRDHIIGLEASVARAQRELEAERAAFEAETERLSGLVTELADDRADLRGSTTWRAGRLVMAPVRLLKRAAR
ncbi:MAG: class I SAM-dependent methyltransferase [Promicromonosporaceae bacterium]|nr:class I SAM-dependent methyltransferase [Promicromonosporaceae bacterium]